MPHVHAHSWRVLSRALRLLGLALGLPLVLLGLPLVLLGRPHGLPRVPLLLLPRLPLLPRRHLLLRIPAGLAVDAREYLAEGGDGAVGCSERRPHEHAPPGPSRSRRAPACRPCRPCRPCPPSWSGDSLRGRASRGGSPGGQLGSARRLLLLRLRRWPPPSPAPPRPEAPTPQGPRSWPRPGRTGPWS